MESNGVRAMELENGHHFESEMENGGSRRPVEAEQQAQKGGGGGAGALFKKAVWHGGSVYDAWLNAVSAQVNKLQNIQHSSHVSIGLNLLQAHS